MNSKLLGTTQMTPRERYVIEIDWSDVLTAGQEITNELAELTYGAARVPVPDALEGLTVSGPKTTVVVKSGLQRGRQYELSIVVTPAIGLTIGSTEERRVLIECV